MSNLGDITANTSMATVATSGAYTDLSGKPTIPAASQYVQIAHATGVNGAALASATLTFEAGVALSTHIPTHAIIKFGSGTLGISVVIVNANGTACTASQALVGLLSTTWMIMPVVSGVISNTGNLTIQVTTASLGASTFDIKLFGITY